MRQAVETALDEIGRRYKVRFMVGRITFQRDGSAASAKLEMVSTEGSSVAATTDSRLLPFVTEWEKKHKRLGLGHYKIGNRFNAMGTEFEIVGLKPRTSRNNLVARNTETNVLHRLDVRFLTAI